MGIIDELILMYRDRLTKVAPEFLETELESRKDLAQLRLKLREYLRNEGVPSNPAVADEWILDRVEEVRNKLPRFTICT